jgi:transcriptional regulator with XRE-family HTH domain
MIHPIGGVSMTRLKWETAEELNQALALRLKKLRKRRGLSQQQLSERSGVSYGSLKRFESTGQISLLSLTKLALALNCADELRSLFTSVAYNSIEEVVREQEYR